MTALPTREGELLVVPVGARLPKVCLKCGAREEITRRATPFTVGGPGQAAGAAGGVGGAVLAQAIRGMDRMVALGVVAVVLGVVSFLAWSMQQSAAKVELALPLCARCDALWTEGTARRTQVIAGLGVSFALLALGWVAYSNTLLAVGGLAFALVIAVALVLQLPKRFVSATKVGADAVSLKIDPAIADDVVARAARYAAKRDAAISG